MNPATTYLVIILLTVSATAASCKTGSGSPISQTTQQSNTHMMHSEGMSERGDQVMGFSHTKVTHHFLLMKDGGAIEAEANDPQDTASRDQIRMHFSHIAEMFAQGNFNAPMLIHDQTPPGVPTMQRLKSEIKYEFEETARGGRVRITTRNRKALAAIHDFLRFQIKEHETGDPLEIQN